MRKKVSKRELLYPFAANYILTKKESIKRQLLSDGSQRIEKKVAILGGYTTSNIKLILELFLLNNGIQPEFYESEYNQFYQDAMFDNFQLEEFRPDIIYVCTSNRNVIRYPVMNDTAEEGEELINSETHRFASVWKSLSEKYGCPIMQNNFEMPFYRLLGNRDAYDIHGKVNFLTRLNTKFHEYAQTHENFMLLIQLDFIVIG